MPNRGASDVATELVREMVGLFDNHKAQLCSDWAHAMDGAGLVSARNMDQIIEDCSAVFDDYVRFIETQSDRDPQAGDEVGRDVFPVRDQCEGMMAFAHPNQEPAQGAVRQTGPQGD